MMKKPILVILTGLLIAVGCSSGDQSNDAATGNITATMEEQGKKDF